MVTGINSSGISVGADGKVQISGFSSSIDTRAIIEATMTAKRVPAVKLENKIVQNQSLISAYGELKSLATDFTSALDKLRGSTSFFSDNVFRQKVASGSTTAGPGAGAGYTPSSIDSLISATVQSGAQVADHTIVVQQLAKAHQIRSDAFTSTTTALTGLGVTAGDIEINGKAVTIDADDTLIDLRGKINAADAGVTATIISGDASTHYLVLTSTDTGTTNAIDFDIGSTTSDELGLTTDTPSAGTIKNELQAALDAVIDIDGITGVTRSTNEIDDVIEGVTLSLMKAEVNTEINLSIEPDLVGVKGAALDLVDAYNALRDFYDGQRTALDRNEDGTVGEGEFGPLAYDNMLRQVMSKLGEMSSASMGDNVEGYQSLGQVGIVVDSSYHLQLDESVFDSKLLTDVDSLRRLFAFDFSSNDARVSFMERTESTQSGTYYLNIGGTDVDGNITSANLQTAPTVGNGGADDGSLTIGGKQVVATDGTSADGLALFFNGGGGLGAVNDIEVTFTRGIADSFYDYFNQLTKLSGDLDTQVQSINETNAEYEADIEQIDARLEVTRSTLVTKYTNMEVALARLESLRNSITSYFDASNSE